MNKLNLEQAISLLKKTVKLSEVKGQKHIDLTLVGADQLEKYQYALMITKQSIANKEITENNLKVKLGLL